MLACLASNYKPYNIAGEVRYIHSYLALIQLAIALDPFRLLHTMYDCWLRLATIIRKLLIWIRIGLLWPYFCSPPERANVLLIFLFLFYFIAAHLYRAWWWWLHNYDTLQSAACQPAQHSTCPTKVWSEFWHCTIITIWRYLRWQSLGKFDKICTCTCNLTTSSWHGIAGRQAKSSWA